MAILPVERGRGIDALAPRDQGRVLVWAGRDRIIGKNNGSERGVGPHPPGDASDYGGRGVGAGGEVMKV